MVAAFDVGTLGQWVLVLIALFAAWRIARGGGGTAVHELSEANRVLEKRIHELGAEVRDLKIENQALRARTDFGAVIAKHEERAESRTDGILKVLDLIAARLGPDEHGHG
jgi:hypothetical protein